MPEPYVLVVGAGPVGLSAALLLDRAGIRCTVLERAVAPSRHPKARGIRVRTMELFAQWGLADRLRKVALPPEANRFIYCDSLAGEEVARSHEVEGTASPVSPETVCRVPQDDVEEALRTRAAQLPHVTLRTGVCVTSLEQSADRVLVRTIAGEELAADYVIGADGVSSTVRHCLGIEMDGPASLGWGHSVYWHADLGDLVENRLCIQFLTGARLGASSSVATVDGRYRWVTMVMHAGGDERPAPLAPDEAIRTIRTAVGRDVDPEILDIATWRISAQVANRWRVGRVFVAGDAAHSFPPTGGFGMNTGVQDVHNLVWKLGLVLTGRAGDRLLDSYEQERKPVAVSNASWSVANGGRFKAIGRAIADHDDAELARLLDEQRNHVDATDQDLGFGYDTGAVRRAPGEDESEPLRFARPGHRFPETVLTIDGHRGSSVLTLADSFHLVAGNPAGWRAAAQRVADTTGLPLVVAGLDQPDVLDGHDAALVRPDGVVACLLNREQAAESAAQLTTCLRELLW